VIRNLWPIRVAYGRAWVRPQVYPVLAIVNGERLCVFTYVLAIGPLRIAFGAPDSTYTSSREA